MWRQAMMSKDYIKSKALNIYLECMEKIQSPFLFVKKPKCVTVSKNIRYGKLHKNRYKVMFDKSITTKQPIMLYVHGGGFVSGDMRSRGNYCYAWVENGYFVANIDYSNAPKYIFPHIYREIFSAIDMIFDNAEKYNIDTTKIVVNGESVGGHIGLFLANFAKDKSLFDKLDIPFRHKAEFDIKGVVSNCGAIDVGSMASSKFTNIKPMLTGYTGKSIAYLLEHKDEDCVKQYSPTITADFPPVFIIYAEKDLLNLESKLLATKLQQLNIPHEIFAYGGALAQHAFSIVMFLEQSKVCQKQSIDFMTKAIQNV